MGRAVLARATGVVGYGGVALCGAPQWVHTLATGNAAGVNPAFVATLAVALVALQIRFHLDRAPGLYRLGNAVALFNALALAGAYAWACLGMGTG